MPWAARKKCARCPRLVPTGSAYCPNCERERKRARPRVRRDYGRPWRRARQAYLDEYPDCARCGRPATDVDHITPAQMDTDLFWDKENWQALCHSCHSRKTAMKDGGFGNAKRR